MSVAQASFPVSGLLMTNNQMISGGKNRCTVLTKIGPKYELRVYYLCLNEAKNIHPARSFIACNLSCGYSCGSIVRFAAATNDLCIKASVSAIVRKVFIRVIVDRSACSVRFGCIKGSCFE